MNTLLRLMALCAALVTAGPGPASGESSLRMNYALMKSFHPNPDRDYATWHPSVGIDGSLVGKWLGWRAGMAYNSQRIWGPFAGLVATVGVAEGWRVGLTAGFAGGWERGDWLSAGAVPIVQWEQPDSALIWEFGFVARDDTTFVGLGVHVPFSVLHE